MIREITIMQAWSRGSRFEVRRRAVEADIPRVHAEIQFLEATVAAARERLAALEAERDALALAEEWEVL